MSRSKVRLRAPSSYATVLTALLLGGGFVAVARPAEAAANLTLCPGATVKTTFTNPASRRKRATTFSCRPGPRCMSRAVPTSGDGTPPAGGR